MKKILLCVGASQAVRLVDDFKIGDKGFKTFLDPHEVNTNALNEERLVKQQQALQQNPDLVFGDSAIRIYNEVPNKDDTEPVDEVHIQFVGDHLELSEAENDKIVGKVIGERFVPQEEREEKLTFSQMLKKAEKEEIPVGEPIATVMEKRNIAPVEDKIVEAAPAKHTHKENFSQKVNNFLENGTNQQPMHF